VNSNATAGQQAEANPGRKPQAEGFFAEAVCNKGA
jgi:hypothetical protein